MVDLAESMTTGIWLVSKSPFTAWQRSTPFAYDRHEGHPSGSDRRGCVSRISERLPRLGPPRSSGSGIAGLGQIVRISALSSTMRIVWFRSVWGKPLEKGFVHCLVGQVAF